MRKKIALKKAIHDSRDVHVIDGGMVLYKTSWPKHITYKELCQHYVQDVRRNYGNSIIVFDGYDSNTTKGHAHVNREKRQFQTLKSMNLLMSPWKKRNFYPMNTTNQN